MLLDLSIPAADHKADQVFLTIFSLCQQVGLGTGELLRHLHARGITPANLLLYRMKKFYHRKAAWKAEVCFLFFFVCVSDL